MQPSARTGRIVGILLFVQLLGLIVPFILIQPVASDSWVATVNADPSRIRIGAFLLFANAALTVGISMLTWRAVRDRGAGEAIAVIVAGVLWVGLQAVDNVHILAMLDMARQFANAGAPVPIAFDTVAASLRSTRRYAHYSTLVMIEAWFFLFYFTLFRHALVPRGLALFALVMPLLHAAGVSLPVLLGYPGMLVLAFALLFSHVPVAGWLVGRGFSQSLPH